MRFSLLTRRLSILAVGSAVALAPWLSTRAADIPADRRLPRDVLVYASVPSIPQAVEAFKQTSVWALIQDPAMQPFREHVTAKIKEGLEEAKSEADFPIDQLPKLFAGEFTIAVSKPFGESLSGIGMIEIGDNKALLDQLIDKIDTAKEEFSRETQTIQGESVTVCTAGDVKVYYLVKDGMLVVTSSVSSIEDLLGRWAGTGDRSLSTNTVYQEIMAKCSSNERAMASLRWYLNPIPLLSAVMSMVPEAAQGAAMVNAFLPQLGLDTYQGMGGVTEWGVGNYETISRTMQYNEPPARGVPKLFTLRSTLSAPPNWVPASAGQFTAIDWDVQAAYGAVQSTYESMFGPGTFGPLVDNLQQQPNAPKLHIKNDIVDALTGVFQFYMIPPTDLEDAKTAKFVVSIGLNRDEQGHKIIDELRKTAPPGLVKETEDGGLKIYSAMDESQPGAVAVFRNAIYIASSVELIKQTNAGPAAAPLIDSPDYQRVARFLPPGMGTLSYQNAGSQLRTAYDAARNGDLDSFTEGEIDFSLLPPFEAIAKYFHPVAGFIVPDEKGALGTQFELKSSN